MSKKTKCKGQCTACLMECHLRRKDYNPNWIASDELLERVIEDIENYGYTERGKEEGNY